MRRRGLMAVLAVGCALSGLVGGAAALAVGERPAVAVGKRPALAEGAAPALAVSERPALAEGAAPALAVSERPALAEGAAPAPAMGGALAVGETPAVVVGDAPAVVVGERRAVAQGGAPAVAVGGAPALAQPAQPGGAPGQPVVQPPQQPLAPSVSVDPDQPSATPHWTISLSAPYCGGYRVGDGVYLSPEAPLSLPSSVPDASVLFAGQAASVSQVDANTLRVGPGPGVLWSQICIAGDRPLNVELLSSAGFGLPDVGGDYTLDVWTGARPTPMSATFSVPTSDPATSDPATAATSGSVGSNQVSWQADQADQAY